jgi:hypothetical protein
MSTHQSDVLDQQAEHALALPGRGTGIVPYPRQIGGQCVDMCPDLGAQVGSFGQRLLHFPPGSVIVVDQFGRMTTAGEGLGISTGGHSTPWAASVPKTPSCLSQ